MSSLATQEIKTPANITPEDVRKYFCESATDKEVFMFLQICNMCNLNPFKREAYLVKYGDKPAMIQTGYEVYLKRAERSGKYAGLESTTEGSVQDKTLKAIVKVYRKDWERPLVHEAYYDEYVQTKYDQITKQKVPNVFWKDKPKTMIKKVAISQAFRLAFPDEFDGMPYTQDEINDMNGHTTQELKPITETVSISEKSEDINESAMGPLRSITEQEGKDLLKLANKNGWTKEDVKEEAKTLGYHRLALINNLDYPTFIERFSKNKAETLKLEQIDVEVAKEWKE